MKTATLARGIAAAWTGAGNQLVVAPIVPSPDQTGRIVESQDLSRPGQSEFLARLADGTQLTYLASAGGTLAAAGVKVKGQALLMVTDAIGQTWGLSLAEETGGLEFVLGKAGVLRQVAEIHIPRGFCWLGAGGQVRAAYE